MDFFLLFCFVFTLGYQDCFIIFFFNYYFFCLKYMVDSITSLEETASLQDVSMIPLQLECTDTSMSPIFRHFYYTGGRLTLGYEKQTSRRTYYPKHKKCIEKGPSAFVLHVNNLKHLTGAVFKPPPPLFYIETRMQYISSCSDRCILSPYELQTPK